MPLSAAEQTKVVQLLGYAGKSIQAGSVVYDKVMNDRLHNLPPESEEIVRNYLGRIIKIEKIMEDAPLRLSTTKVDNLELNHRELEMLRAERKKISREIADLVDIPYQGRGACMGVRS